MTLSNTLTTLMDSARKHFEVNQKLSIANLINLFNPNPNLLTGIKDWSGAWQQINTYTKQNTYKGLDVLYKKQAWSGASQSISLSPGTYTFSLYAKSDIDETEAIIYLLMVSSTSENISLASKAFSLTTNWQRCSATFSVTKEKTIAPRIELTQDTDSIYICGYKLEEGSLPTPLTELGG